MDITLLDQELRSNRIRFCYAVYGPERYLVSTAKKAIRKAIFKEGPQIPDTFYAGSDSLHRILDHLRTSSLFASCKLVFVEEADKFKKKDWENLKEFLEEGMEKHTLVLVASSLKATEIKMLPKLAGLIECKKMYPRQVATWLNMEARELGLNLSKEAAHFLIDSVGTDLGELHQALEKLFLFVGARKLIQLQDVEIAVSQTAQRSLFDLANAVGDKKLGEAMALLSTILEGGEEPLRILALISRHFRLLAKAQEILGASKEHSEAYLAQALKVHPFFAKDYARQSRNFKKIFWGGCFKNLALCDRSLKSSRHPPKVILEKLILDTVR